MLSPVRRRLTREPRNQYGLTYDAPALTDAARILHGAGCLDGVLTRAGESYFAFTPEEQRLAAENERDIAVAAAERLRTAGLPVATVSVGSTPTAHAATDLTGVTELRAGTYVFYDLVMAGLGVCDIQDLALAVVVTVIGPVGPGAASNRGGFCNGLGLPGASGDAATRPEGAAAVETLAE